MDYYLLIGSIGAILLAFAMAFDHRGPKILSLKYVCKRNGILTKLFPVKESRVFPHYVYKILPLFISLIIFPVVLIIYIIYWIGNVELINEFIKSNYSLWLGCLLLVLYFIFPIVILIIDKISEIRQRNLGLDKLKELEQTYEEYYKQLDCNIKK